MDLRDFTELKERIESLERKLERSKGASSQLRRTLKEEFDCDSLKEAIQLLEQEEQELASLEEKHEKSIEAFEETHANFKMA